MKVRREARKRKADKLRIKKEHEKSPANNQQGSRVKALFGENYGECASTTFDLHQGW
jgi:hypothetical protein